MTLTPLAPVPNAVAFLNRVSVILNRAGTELQNPICGTNRYLGNESADPSGGGFNIRVSFALQDSSEVVTAAQVHSYDDSDNFVGTTSFKGSIVHNTTTLTATADLIAGVDFPASSLGRRNEIVVQTNANRQIKQQLHCRNHPTDIVTLNGIVTTETTPLEFELEQIDVSGNFSATFRCAFFASWNDEVGRQHGAENVNLNGAIAKPYGGAKTVEVFREVGNDPFGEVLVAEANCETVTTLTWAPTSDGETLHLSFKFRSASGSAEFVLGEAWVRFFECEVAAPSSTVEICLEHPIIFLPAVYPEPPLIPDDDVGTFDPDGATIDVGIDQLGNSGSGGTDFTTGTLRIAGFHGGIRNFGSGVPFVVPLGEQIVALTDSDVGTTKTITLDTDIQSASLLVVSVESEAGGTGTIRGNSIVYVSQHTDTGIVPGPPEIASSPAPSFNFTTRQLDFTVDDFGWVNENMTVNARPLYGVVRSLAGQAQTYDDIGLDTGAFDNELVLYTSGTGAKSVTFDFLDNDIEGVIITFTNSFGRASISVFFDEGFTDSGLIRSGPTISSASLTSSLLTNDTVQFTLDDDGGAGGNMTYFYAIVDVNQAQVQVTGSASIAPGSGSRQFVLGSGHDDIDGHYYVGIWNEQGGLSSMNLLHVNNVGGANTLGA